jgi:uncharacterized NAD(P)/FAD-binding protein YdhS
LFGSIISKMFKTDNITIAIIGGGYIGATTAIHLARYSQLPLNICIIEPSASLGEGIAFSTQDEDHRLNGPTGIQFLYPENTESFNEWHENSGAKAADPGSIAVDGRVYARRSDFGAYVASEVLSHQKKNPSNSIIKHYQDTAFSLSKNKGDWSIELLSRDKICAKIVIVTPCNFSPAIPFELKELVRHPMVYTNPWNIAKFSGIAPNANILIIGTGLTMSDVTVSLLRDGPMRKITAISRRGLRPKNQRSHPPIQPIWKALNRPVPAFIERHGLPKTILAIFQAFRADIAQLKAENIEWQVAFDELRDAAYQLWPSLPLAEQARYFRHLSPWYDTHRFRLPPQVEEKLLGYLLDGHLKYRVGFLGDLTTKGSLIEVKIRARGKTKYNSERFDAVINCTGPDRDPLRSGNPFLVHLIHKGFATASSFGLGLEVDQSCQSMPSRDVEANQLFMLGPLTRNQFGEINGIPSIVHQIYRVTREITTSIFQEISNQDSL